MEPPTTTQDPSQLDILADDLRRRSSTRLSMWGLTFNLAPNARTEVPSVPSMDPNDPDLHKLSLAPGVPANSPVTGYERWLFDAKEMASAQKATNTHIDLSHEIEREFAQLQHEKIIEWIRQKEEVQLQNRSDELMTAVMRPNRSLVIDTGKSSPLARRFD